MFPRGKKEIFFNHSLKSSSSNQDSRTTGLVEIIIEEGKAAERPPEAGAGDQEVKQQPHVSVVGVECVQVRVSGSNVVPRIL